MTTYLIILTIVIPTIGLFPLVGHIVYYSIIAAYNKAILNTKQGKDIAFQVVNNVAGCKASETKYLVNAADYAEYYYTGVIADKILSLIAIKQAKYTKEAIESLLPIPSYIKYYFRSKLNIDVFYPHLLWLFLWFLIAMVYSATGKLVLIALVLSVVSSIVALFLAIRRHAIQKAKSVQLLQKMINDG